MVIKLYPFSDIRIENFVLQTFFQYQTHQKLNTQKYRKTWQTQQQP